VSRHLAQGASGQTEQEFAFYYRPRNGFRLFRLILPQFSRVVEKFCGPGANEASYRSGGFFFAFPGGVYYDGFFPSGFYEEAVLLEGRRK